MILCDPTLGMVKSVLVPVLVLGPLVLWKNRTRTGPKLVGNRPIRFKYIYHVIFFIQKKIQKKIFFLSNFLNKVWHMLFQDLTCSLFQISDDLFKVSWTLLKSIIPQNSLEFCESTNLSSIDSSRIDSLSIVLSSINSS